MQRMKQPSTSLANGCRSQICFWSCSDLPFSQTSLNGAICRKYYHRGCLMVGKAELLCSPSYLAFRLFSTTLPVPSSAGSWRVTSTQRASQSDSWLPSSVLLALSGHGNRLGECLLSGVKRTLFHSAPIVR